MLGELCWANCVRAICISASMLLSYLIESRDDAFCRAGTSHPRGAARENGNALCCGIDWTPPQHAAGDAIGGRSARRGRGDSKYPASGPA